jgi:hypothetical protein
LSDALELLRHALVGGDDFIKCVGDLALDAQVIAGHPHREIAGAHRLQGVQHIFQRVRLAVCGQFAFCGTAKLRGGPGGKITHGVSWAECTTRVAGLSAIPPHKTGCFRRDQQGTASDAAKSKTWNPAQRTMPDRASGSIRVPKKYFGVPGTFSQLPHRQG